MNDLAQYGIQCNMVNFMVNLTHKYIAGKILFLGLSVRVFLEEIRI